MKKLLPYLILLLLVSGITTGCAPETQKLEPTEETKQKLDNLVNSNDYVTGYNIVDYDYPTIIVDYTKIVDVINKQDTEKTNQLLKDLDSIGKQVSDMGYPDFIFSAQEEEELKQVAQYEMGATFFSTDWLALGVRVKQGDLIIQNTQVDKSGYYPAVIGLIYNAGSKDLSNVYIELNLINEQGSIVGFTNDSIGSLKSGDTWQFKCDVVQSADSFELSKLTSY